MIFPLEELQKKEIKPHIHFIGIGGVHMSAYAELIYRRGFPVSGNDRDESENVLYLRKIGINVETGHKPEYVEGCDIIIRNAAIAESSPDIVRARELGIPIYERPEVLGALMRNSKARMCIAGTHGKSTTTAMCAKIAVEAGTDPTIFCGARLTDTGIAYRFGGEDLFIAESCEYFDSFLNLYPTHAAVLNIEPDHLDYFSDINQIRSSFKKFALLVPKDGVVVAGGDDPAIRELYSDIGRKVVYFGLDEKNDWYPSNISTEKGNYNFDIIAGEKFFCHVALKVPGLHNVMDALASAAICAQYGISAENIASSLSEFGGAKRRFEHIGSFGGVDVVDDFAHHPTELAATLEASKKLGYKRIICVYQPHTYSRTSALYKEFAKALSLADIPILAPIYAAREKNVNNISSHLIADEMKDCTVFDDMNDILPYVQSIAEKGDVVITAGAGDVYKIGYALIKSK